MKEENAITEAPPAEEADDELPMGWVSTDGKPMLTQFHKIMHIFSDGLNAIEEILGMEEEGLDRGRVSLETKLDQVDIQVLNVAVTLVGFFDEEIRPHADALLRRLSEEHDVVRKAVSEETRLEALDAFDRYNNRRLAELIGVSVEDLEATTQAEEVKVLDGGTEPTLH